MNIIKNDKTASRKVPFWQRTAEELLIELNSCPEGITLKKATHLLKEYGPNTITTSLKRGLIALFLERFKNPLILLLLLAAVLVAMVGNVQSAFIIIVIIFASVGIDFFQEYRANQAADTLKCSVAIKAWVWRNNRKQEIATEKLVPGDIVELTAGDLVPGDGLILEAKDFFIDQSTFTGESFPIEKHCIPNVSSVKKPEESPQTVLMGTAVTNGYGRIIICKTGQDTILGHLSQILKEKPHLSSFVVNTQQLGAFLMRLMLFLVVATIIINLYFERPWLDTCLFAIALGIGITPEFLPIIISVTLARGAVAMARQKVIVKKISAIYDLGCMDTLCTDKTGTLTKGHIQLEKCLDAQGKTSEHTLFLAYLNSYFETGSKNPFRDAILKHPGFHQDDKWKKIDELPFDFERRRVSILVNGKEENLIIVKGPVENILKVCNFISSQNGSQLAELNEESRQKIFLQFETLSKMGKRILGIAWRSDFPRQQLTLHDEENLIFSGFVVFSDSLKEGVTETLQSLLKDNINLKIVTGDNEYVTQYLCKELSVSVQKVLLGPEIESMTDTELYDTIEGVTLFCQVTPEQKRRIIIQLQNHGRVVGFMGDGINDVAALRAANVSISVHNATAVAKDAAHFILLQRDLRVLHQGILAGRKTFANILKYAMMSTSSNLGNAISMVVASLFLPFLPMLPTQILLNNLLYDISEIAIPFDNADDSFLSRPIHFNIKFIQNFATVLGPLSSLFDFFVFYLLFYYFHANESLFQTGWFVESLATQVLVILVIRTHKNPFKDQPHPILLISSIVVTTIGIILPYTSLGSYFNFTPLPWSFLVALFIIVIFYLGLSEISKQLFYKFWPLSKP